MRTSFSSLTGCAHTRYGWKGATHRRTPIVTRTRNDTCRTDFDGVLADAAPRRLPRTQSWDGMGVRGGAGDAGAKGERSSQIARSDCRRPRDGHWLRGADYRVSRHDAAAHRHPLLRRGGHGRPWDLLPGATCHPRWVRMQVGFRDLTVWSFLMASAHGAGLMVVPALLGSNMVEAQGRMAGHNHMASVASPLAGMVATGVHTVAYLAVTGLLAWIVYRKLGLALLRKAWFNFDLVWAAALMATGLVTLLI